MEEGEEHEKREFQVDKILAGRRVLRTAAVTFPVKYQLCNYLRSDKLSEDSYNAQ